MKSKSLSLFSGAVSDIPPRAAQLLKILAAFGVITIVVESLVGLPMAILEWSSKLTVCSAI